MPQSKTPVKEKPKEEVSGKKLAGILIRGLININPDIKKTLYLLRFRKKHTCVVIADTAVNKGMLVRCKDYVTWGEIDEETLKELQNKRKIKYEKLYHLQSPRGGFERKGIKKPYSEGGVLGYRGEKISDLVKRMI